MAKITKILKQVDTCVFILLCCNFFILLGLPLGNDSMVSFGSRIMILTVCLYGGSYLLKILTEKKSSRLDVYFLLLVLFSIIATLSFGIGIWVRQLIPFICFLMFPILMLLYRYVSNIQRVKTWVYFFNFLYFFIYLYLYSTPLKYIGYGEFGTIICDDLSLGYQNPNQTGLQLLISFLIMVSFFEYVQNGIIKIVAAVSSAVLGYMIFETNSRTCIIIIVIVCVLYITGLIKKLNRKTILIAMLIPAAMWILLSFQPSWIVELEILGDEFDTGRLIIFQNVIKDLDVYSLLFGDFSKYATSNLHNSYFTIFATFGIIVFFIYLVYIKATYEFYFARMGVAEKKNYAAFVGMLCVIVHGATEATFLVSGMVYASLAALLFVLVQGKGGKE